MDHRASCAPGRDGVRIAHRTWARRRTRRRRRPGRNARRGPRSRASGGGPARTGPRAAAPRAGSARRSRSTMPSIVDGLVRHRRQHLLLALGAVPHVLVELRAGVEHHRAVSRDRSCGHPVPHALERAKVLREVAAGRIDEASSPGPPPRRRRTASASPSRRRPDGRWCDPACAPRSAPPSRPAPPAHRGDVPRRPAGTPGAAPRRAARTWRRRARGRDDRASPAPPRPARRCRRPRPGARGSPGRDRSRSTETPRPPRCSCRRACRRRRWERAPARSAASRSVLPEDRAREAFDLGVVGLAGLEPEIQQVA